LRFFIPVILCVFAVTFFHRITAALIPFLYAMIVFGFMQPAHPLPGAVLRMKKNDCKGLQIRFFPNTIQCGVKSCFGFSDNTLCPVKHTVFFIEDSPPAVCLSAETIISHGMFRYLNGKPERLIIMHSENADGDTIKIKPLRTEALHHSL